MSRRGARRPTARSPFSPPFRGRRSPTALRAEVAPHVLRRGVTRDASFHGNLRDIGVDGAKAL